VRLQSQALAGELIDDEISKAERCNSK
jgi:hypothetical protein